MASRIQVLPPELADQIAAGEVVERPASVVKELVENAIDAAATKVTIEVEGGGRRLIRVTDDGIGMTLEDARLALKRHATSKLTSADDLFHLTTLGFRGEALPSIAAVSRFTITTRTREEIAGAQVEVVGGIEREHRAVGCPPGTQVEVRDLLFNVPARLKFLKADTSESAAVTEAILRLGLSHPALHLVLRHGGRTVVELPPHGEERERIVAALGRRGRTGFALAEGEEGGVRVRAYLGKPEESQPTSRGVYIFVNQRFVRDRALVHALVTGYGELVARGRYPEALVMLEIAGGCVDVNVHPQKLEVRFARPQEVQAALRHVVRDAVARAPWLREGVPAVANASAPIGNSGSAGDSLAERATARLADLAPAPFMREAVQQYLASEGGQPLDDWGGLRLAPRAGAEAQLEPSIRAPSSVPDSGSPEPYFSRLAYLGQLHCLYLVCQSPGELVLVDQHAAHERVAFERLRRSYLARAMVGQRLLFPVTLDPGADLLAAAEEGAELLAACGLEVEPFGPRSLVIKSVPEALAGCDPSPLVADVLAELAEGGVAHAVAHRLEHVFATMACHSVTRAGDALTRLEAEALLTSMDGVDRRANCPHGRPVVLRMRMEELARKFERA